VIPQGLERAIVDVHVVGDRLGVGGTVFFAGADGYIWTGR